MILFISEFPDLVNAFWTRFVKVFCLRRERTKSRSVSFTVTVRSFLVVRSVRRALEVDSWLACWKLEGKEAWEGGAGAAAAA